METENQQEGTVMERRPITGQRRGRPGLNPCPWLALATAALVSLSPLAQARAGTPAVAQGGPAPMGMGMGGGPQGQRSADAHFRSVTSNARFSDKIVLSITFYSNG